MRMVMVSQLGPDGQMRGLITTLSKQRAQLMPVSAPIVYIKRDDFSGVALGESQPAMPAMASIAASSTKPSSKSSAAHRALTRSHSWLLGAPAPFREGSSCPCSHPTYRHFDRETSP